MAVGHQFVAGFLHIGADAIAHRLNQIRDKFLSFKHLLPYGNTINAKNVFSHARAIARMSNILEQQQQQAAAAAARAMGAAPAPVERNTEGELGPAAKALAESQKPALEAAKLEAKIPKDYSKRRKRVTFEEGKEKNGPEEEEKEPKKVAAEADGEDEDEDEDEELGSDLDAAEVNMYLRSEEEVEAFKVVYQALEGAAAERGGR